MARILKIMIQKNSEKCEMLRFKCLANNLINVYV